MTEKQKKRREREQTEKRSRWDEYRGIKPGRLRRLMRQYAEIQRYQRRHGLEDAGDPKDAC